jgi:hypothetical protein
MLASSFREFFLKFVLILLLKKCGKLDMPNFKIHSFNNFAYFDWIVRRTIEQHAVRRDVHPVPNGGGLPLLPVGQQHHLLRARVRPLLGGPVVPSAANGGLPPTIDQ